MDASAPIDGLAAGYPVRVKGPLLASRGIYFLEVTDPDVRADPKKVAKLAKEIGHGSGVDYAEANSATVLVDRRYHGWPDGVPVDAGTEASRWLTQPVTAYLVLDAAHEISTGAGSVVAVLDTGADLLHPALAGQLTAGYDYVDDDDDPSDEAQGLDSSLNGRPDEAHGHGTFVAGTVALARPDATIMPMRVLDSDGHGNMFALAASRHRCGRRRSRRDQPQPGQLHQEGFETAR